MQKSVAALRASPWALRSLAAVLVLGTLNSASPVQFGSMPFIPAGLQPLKRGTSKDQSCPSGFLCEVEQCPDGVLCPSGESCINFEGTLACVPLGGMWCALNPDTFQGIGCLGNGLCCHGNCYVSDAVCCDNPSVICEVGTLCNACEAGQTCGKGSATCIGSVGSSSTSSTQTTTKGSSVIQPEPTTTKASSTPSSISTSPTSPQPTTTKSSTSSQSTTSLISSQSITTTTTSFPTPSIVQQDGSYKYIGCYIDDGSNALVVSNSTDLTMSVEECVALAKKQKLRYSGVKSGSQCFGGNTLHTTNKPSSDTDCKSICAGNPGEYCGGSSRLQLYEDSTWSDPTLDELTNVLLQYNSSLFQLSQLADQYHGLMQQWADQQNGHNKRRSGAKRSLTLTELQHGLSEIETQYPVVRRILDQAAVNGGRIFVVATSQDVVRPGQPNPFVDSPTLDRAEQAFDIPLSHLDDVHGAIEDDLRTISDAGSTAPLLNIDRDLQVASTATTAIGKIIGDTIEHIAAGVGVFSLIALVFLHLHPSSISNPSPTTIIGGPSITVTTTTSTATSTATTTPYFIVAANGVSVSDFQALTDKLSNGPNNNKVKNGPFGIAQVVALNDTALIQAKTSNLVNSVTHNELNDEESGRLSIVQKRTLPATGHAFDGAIPDPTNIVFRNRREGDQFLGHLRQLSAAFFDNAYGTYNPKKSYAFEANPGKDIWVYVIDDGVSYTHQEFVSTRRDPQIVIGEYKPNLKHGTGVASLAVGKNIGVASSANLVSVAFDLTKEGDVWDALTAAYNDIIAKGREGKAVVNMSWFLASADRVREDFWMVNAIRKFIAIGVVPICASGNGGEKTVQNTIDDIVPSAYVRFVPGLISVGAVDGLAKRAPFSQRCDLGDTTSDCVTAYAMGNEVMGAISETDVNYELKSGTSFAAGIVSGLAAYIMAHPDQDLHDQVFGKGLEKIADTVSALIEELSWSRNPQDPLNYPNVVWNFAVVNICNFDKWVGEANSEDDGDSNPDEHTGSELEGEDEPITLADPSTCPKAKRARAELDADIHGMLVCHQPRGREDLSSDDIKASLIHGIIDQLCGTSAHGDKLKIPFLNATMVATVRHEGVEILESCNSGIQAIIDGCIQRNFFGGVYSQGNTTYSISKIALLD